MLMLSYIISLPNSVAADETKTAAAELKPYKILFQGNQALSETALRKAVMGETTKLCLSKAQFRCPRDT